MVKKIAITNQKGGVGKSTTAINLTASLALKKANVLLIDCDPQGNATTGSGVDKNAIEWGLQDVLLENCSIDSAILETSYAYHLLPTNADLTAAEVGLMQQNQRSNI